MCLQEHVKELKESIKSNGGLIDPIIVRDGDFVVLEGNSRLAAYRILYKTDPIKWAKIKVTLLPKDIPESAVFTLLGQYHIVGKDPWDPYEQAGYLYRRGEADQGVRRRGHCQYAHRLHRLFHGGGRPYCGANGPEPGSDAHLRAFFPFHFVCALARSCNHGGDSGRQPQICLSVGRRRTGLFAEERGSGADRQIPF